MKSTYESAQTGSYDSRQAVLDTSRDVFPRRPYGDSYAEGVAQQPASQGGIQRYFRLPSPQLLYEDLIKRNNRTDLGNMAPKMAGELGRGVSLN